MVAIQKQLVHPGSTSHFKREVEPRIRIHGCYLSTGRDDFSRQIVAWKLCTRMSASDVMATLDLALAAAE